ncbi:melatonin receptor type 1A-like [Bombina bombina]|uniref:melatonin receptor type 1A-like n=1 Tax=Bombina bombina TaxID=8345 RepID=UPI00235AAAF0|nr:melatonin receptor type 1A-like [Bombina bombina]
MDQITTKQTILGDLEEEHNEYPIFVVSTMTTVLIITISGDIVGNLLVITSVFRNKKLRKAGNAFVVSLAVADLLVACYPYPLILLAVFNQGWNMGPLHCQLSGFFMGLSVMGSVFNITGIAVNRYCYICHSTLYHRIFSNTSTVCYVGLVWALALAAIVPNLFVGSLRYDPRVFSCTFSQSVSSFYTIVVVIFHFFLPISVVSYCYLRIWVLVLNIRHRVRSDRSLRSQTWPYNIHSFITMFVVFVLFAVCWGPLNIIGLTVAIHPSLGDSVPSWLFVASYFMAYFNSCLNAVVYGALNKNFRREYKKIMLNIFQMA